MILPQYNVLEVFDTRLKAISFYHSIYEYTIKFRIITMQIFLKQTNLGFTVYGSVSLVGNLPGITEMNIINHIKNNID